MWKTASILVGAVLVLLTLGIVMLASTSGVRGDSQFGDSLYFVKRQVFSLIVALSCGMLAARFPYRHWRLLAIPLALLSIALLVWVLARRVMIKGSARWLHFGPISFQPSELAKLATVVLLAWWMARVQRRAGSLKAGLAVPIVCLAVMIGLIFFEPDFGTTMLIGVVGMAMMFVGGTRFSYLVVAGAAGLAAFTAAVMHDEERMRRIIAFLNPERYAKDEAWQLLNAIYAFVVGGARGVGLGHGLQKQFYLPEAHTDFIFAIIGEELGLIASAAVVVLFVVVFVCGVRIALRAPDDFGMLLAFGITLMITVQAGINMGVVTGCLPTKGLPLPFISFGGTSLVVSAAMIGILVNISRHAVGEEGIEWHAIKDQAHTF